ncbi:reverse transcriptase domain-containing protein [Tanacetum coccineum]
MCNLLQRSLDVFAWTPADMTGIPRHIVEHRLNVREGCQPIRQKKRGQAAERNIAINDEVSKLVAARIMRVVHYHDWLSNPVMVRKHDDSWRMCVDFKYLNKACPKDGYPLPEINWKVESLCGFPFKYFLDAYKGYHQIQMAEEDEEKTTFITNQGIFCYRKMPFGLRNADATYQRLVDKAFHGQISRNLKVYVDDLVIKSRTEDEIVRDIEETFKTLRKINMKLNLKKCTFGVEKGMFLGYQVLVEELKEKSINEIEVFTVVEEEGDSWMTPIHEYLTDETLPAERKKARAIKQKSQCFAIINEMLYKKSFLGPWLRCVGPSQVNYVLLEIHEGSCSMHAGPRSVIAKALRIGNPQEKLNPITSPWPFYKWGIDIAEPFPEGPGKVKFLIVVMDYFTKWIKAKPVATITGNQVKKFVWENIVCRFGLPGEIISDNGKQFRDNPFIDWCEKLCIQQHFSSVKHPQTNGLVERANRSLGEGIKASLGKDNKNWMEEISHVLWANRTMVKSSNGDTSFSLTYGTEAVISAEIGMPTFRTAEVDVTKNDEALKINLELLEEKREQAAIREAKSKRQMEKYYNAKVRNTSFKPGDLVYRNNEASHAEDTIKLGPK